MRTTRTDALDGDLHSAAHVKAKLIVNPVAGRDQGPDYLPLINAKLREHLDSLDIVMTVAEGDATRAAAEAVREGIDLVFAAGGDGTLNEVLNGVAQVEGGLEKVTFGIIPLGTGNDFATALGFSTTVEDVLEEITASEVRAVDVGVLDQHYFVNTSGGGFIAEVSDAVDPRLKTIAGKLAYLIGGAQVLLNHEPVGARVSLRTGLAEGPPHLPDGAHQPGRAASARDEPDTLDFVLQLHAFAVCNSRLIGGGRLIAPDAVVDDGLLDVCLIEAMPTLDFLSLLSRVSDGEHVRDERVRYFRSPEIAITFDRVIKVNTDGQVLEADACVYRVLPRAARFLVPARTTPR